MTSVSIETVALIVYVMTDDWYQQNSQRYLAGKPGEKPTFSDSEVMTLLILQDFIPFPGENQFIGYIRANYLHLFPKLVDQSQFNRRAKGLRYLVEAMRRDWLLARYPNGVANLLLDTKPIPVVGVKRSKKKSHFAGTAAYGYCASKKMHYYGFKLVTLCTLDGIPIASELVPANYDERLAAESVLNMVSDCHVYGDKGFIGKDWQARIAQTTGNTVITHKRRNQYVQHSKEFNRWLSRIRERIEGVFHELQNTGRNIEKLRAKTVLGLVTRVIGKLTSHLVKLLLREQHGIDVQTFTQTPIELT